MTGVVVNNTRVIRSRDNSNFNFIKDQRQWWWSEVVRLLKLSHCKYGLRTHALIFFGTSLLKTTIIYPKGTISYGWSEKQRNGPA